MSCFSCLVLGCFGLVGGHGKTESNFSIFALEPDPQNFAKLQAYLTSLQDRGASITALPYAVGRRRETLRFSASGTDNASVALDGSVTVEAVSLDELLADESPTFIKMDIEGFELEALAGVAATIRRCRPIMAITVYHLCDHLWKVPLAIVLTNVHV